MKIADVRSYIVPCGGRNAFVVVVETDGGLIGLGEGGMSARELAMEGYVRHLREFLIGMDARNIEHIWQTMYRGAYFEGGKISGATISAIDIALWDIKAQSLGVPVYQLLGGACRERVRTFATVFALNSPECVERARELFDEGWRYLRFTPEMPPGTPEDVYEPMESIQLAAHWIREVRDTVGPAVGLSIDFHHRLSVAEAAHFCAQVEDVHLMFLEEPIRAQNPAAYRQLRTMTNVPFAVGEEASNKWELLPYIEDGLIEFCRLDVCNVGGLTEAKKIAGWCEAHYIDLMPHNPLGPIASAASVHLCAATNNVAQLEFQHRIHEQIPSDIFPKILDLDGDSYPLPDEPGLGIEFDEGAAAEQAMTFWEPPHYRRRDGAYTNW
ncbi:galactonate dehydratase [soil metagenome]